MALDKITRRQFVGGAAAVVGAAAIPSVLSVAPAAAAGADYNFASSLYTLKASWTPLDPLAAARQGYEIYKGRWTGQSG